MSSTENARRNRLDERGAEEQCVTLRAHLPGCRPLVAVECDPDLVRVLAEAKSDLGTQIERHETERGPESNRQPRRDTIRSPGSRAGAGS